MPELDGLRFLAFFAVFVFHTLPANPARWGWLGSASTWVGPAFHVGALGVDLFFCLSAFLITELLRVEHERTGRIDIPRFLMRRLLRIWPLYFTYLGAWCLTFVLAGELGALPTRDLVWYAVFLGNWAAASWGPTHTCIDHMWSVSVEEQFYVVWPLLLGRIRSADWRLVPIALLACAWTTRWWLHSRGGDAIDFSSNSLARLDPIAVGAILSLAGNPLKVAPASPLRPLLLAVCFLSLVGLTRTFGLHATTNLPAAVGLQSAHAILCGGILIAAHGAEGGPLGWFLRHRWIVALGRISYGLYVWHILCIRAAELLWTGLFGNWLPEGWRPVALVFTLVAGFLSYRIIERPFLRMKERFAVVPSRPE
jgi:peptidoglycan/LPS O-acetylase OafA/YrhL